MNNLEKDRFVNRKNIFIVFGIIIFIALIFVSFNLAYKNSIKRKNSADNIKNDDSSSGQISSDDETINDNSNNRKNDNVILSPKNLDINSKLVKGLSNYWDINSVIVSPINPDILMYKDFIYAKDLDNSLKFYMASELAVREGKFTYDDSVEGYDGATPGKSIKSSDMKNVFYKIFGKDSIYTNYEKAGVFYYDSNDSNYKERPGGGINFRSTKTLIKSATEGLNSNNETIVSIDVITVFMDYDILYSDTYREKQALKLKDSDYNYIDNIIINKSELFPIYRHTFTLDDVGNYIYTSIEKIK